MKKAKHKAGGGWGVGGDFILNIGLMSADMAICLLLKISAGKNHNEPKTGTFSKKIN